MNVLYRKEPEKIYEKSLLNEKEKEIKKLYEYLFEHKAEPILVTAITERITKLDMETSSERLQWEQINECMDDIRHAALVKDDRIAQDILMGLDGWAEGWILTLQGPFERFVEWKKKKRIL